MKAELEKKVTKVSATRKVVYVIILIVCIITIAIGIYMQFFREEKLGLILWLDNLYTDIDEAQYIELKSNFDNLFTNSLNFDKQDDIGNNEKDEILFTKYDISQKQDNFEIDVKVPYINIDNEVVDRYNNDINNIFIQKIIDIFLDRNNVDKKYIYKIDYTAHIYNGILSVAIRSNLKEGNNPQRVIVQTYNYNMNTNENVTINDLLELKGINTQYATDKIRDEIKQQEQKVQELNSLGYSVYARDYTSDIYNIENATEYFIDSNGYLYVIYAYGNDNFTSEMDFVIF